MLTTTDGIILGLLLGIALVVLGYRFYQHYITKKRVRKGIRGEKEAKAILKRHGYTIIKEQLDEVVTLEVDDKLYECKIRADFLVKRGLKTYIVEVKTGKKARPTLPDIRRQLLEYDLVFRPDGLLFIDMKKGEIEAVRFHTKLKGYHFYDKLMYLLIGAVIGFLMSALVLKAML